MAGSGNDTHSWITTIAALGRVGYRAEMRSRRANAELPKWDRRLNKRGPLLQAGERVGSGDSLPECHPTQHGTQSTLGRGRSRFFKGLLHNRERILQVSSVNDVPLFPN